MQDLDKIISDLTNDVVYPFYLLHGEEAYFIDKIYDYFKNYIIDEQARDFDLSIVYGKDTSISHIVESSKRYPLISKYQLIIIKEAQGLKKEYGPLIKYLENPQKTSIIVFCYKNKDFDKRLNLYKSAVKSGIVFHSKKLKDKQIIPWISNQIKSLGLISDLKSIHLIYESLGNNLSRINNELNKLKITLDDNIINLDSVEKHIGINKDYNNFELINAIIKKDKNMCLKIIYYLSDNSKSSPLVLTIAMIFQFFKRLLIFHSISDSSHVASSMGINPYFLNDYKVASVNFKMRSCSKIIEKIHIADLKSKGIRSSNVNSKDILVDLINDIFEY